MQSSADLDYWPRLSAEIGDVSLEIESGLEPSTKLKLYQVEVVEHIVGPWRADASSSFLAEVSLKMSHSEASKSDGLSQVAREITALQAQLCCICHQAWAIH